MCFLHNHYNLCKYAVCFHEISGRSKSHVSLYPTAMMYSILLICALFGVTQTTINRNRIRECLDTNEESVLQSVAEYLENAAEVVELVSDTGSVALKGAASILNQAANYLLDVEDIEDLQEIMRYRCLQKLIMDEIGKIKMHGAQIDRFIAYSGIVDSFDEFFGKCASLEILRKVVFQYFDLI
ncbi:hypothetical protein AB6A40_007435 [Gnathostoma spinigerum]|uniref:Uncharacterized protein n=1 Tax=Gnathostoma spinigerum TaxID=75299 RepID=A0ABD6ETF0_9BILA